MVAFGRFPNNITIRLCYSSTNDAGRKFPKQNDLPKPEMNNFWKGGQGAFPKNIPVHQDCKKFKTKVHLSKPT